MEVGEGGPKDFWPKKLQPSQASKLPAGNLGGCCKPPDEIHGSEVPGNLGN